MCCLYASLITYLQNRLESLIISWDYFLEFIKSYSLMVEDISAQRWKLLWIQRLWWGIKQDLITPQNKYIIN